MNKKEALEALKSITAEIEAGTIELAEVRAHTGWTIVEFRHATAKTPKFTGIHVIDLSMNKPEVSRPAPGASPVELPKARKVIDTVDKATCPYCGLACTKRGLTRHTNKCKEAPSKEANEKDNSTSDRGD